MTALYWTVGLLGFFVLLATARAGFLFAPWVPTRRRDAKRIKALMNPKPGQVIYELGSGTGHVARELANDTQATVIGYEMVFPLWIWSKWRAYQTGSSARFFWRDFFKADLSDADALYFFGTQERLQGRFQKKLWDECKVGTKIYSYAFTFEGIDPVRIDKPTQEELSIFIYEIR